MKKFIVDFEGEEEYDEPSLFLQLGPHVLSIEIYMIPVVALEIAEENRNDNPSASIIIKYKLKDVPPYLIRARDVIDAHDLLFYRLQEPKFATGFTIRDIASQSKRDLEEMVGYWWQVVLPDGVQTPSFPKIGHMMFFNHASDFEYFEILSHENPIEGMGALFG